MSIKQGIKNITPSVLLNLYRKFYWRSYNKNYGKKSKKSYSLSQAGQDFWVYGEVFNEKNDGFFLDVGAADGVQINNTYLLEKRYQWNGICIEGNPKVFNKLKKNRSCLCVNACIDSEARQVNFQLDGLMGGIVSDDCDNKSIKESVAVVNVETQKLEDVLKKANAPHVIDYLSIDIEGAEDRALLEFPFNEYRFNCITIERPSEKLREKFSENNYVLVKEIKGLDCFYVHNDFYDEYCNNVYRFFNRKEFVMKAV